MSNPQCNIGKKEREENDHVNASYNLLPIALPIVKDCHSISPRLRLIPASFISRSELVIDFLKEKLVKSEMLSGLSGNCYAQLMRCG